MISDLPSPVPYFPAAERLAALRLAAHAWLGTPFHARARLRGVGADCVQLVAGIFLDCGYLSAFTPPAHYTMTGGSHLDSSVITTWLDSAGHFARIEFGRTPGFKPCCGGRPRESLPCPDCLQPGDLLGLKLGRVVHHLGLYLGAGQFIHTYHPYPAHLALIADTTWLKRWHTTYRPLEFQSPNSELRSPISHP